MSHDFVAAAHSASDTARKATRRKVTFQTTIEDLEGRVLMSGATYRIRAAQAQIRVAKQAKVKVRMTRAQILAARRAAQAPVINVTPSITVSTNVAGSTNSYTPAVSYVPATTSTGTAATTAATTPATTSTSTSHSSSTPTAVGTVTPAGTTGSGSSTPSTGQAWPALVAPSTTTNTSTTTTPATTTTPTTTTPTTTTPATTTTTTPTTTTPATTTTTTPTTTTPATPTPAPPTFADGTLIVNDQTGEIREYSGGQGHLISTPVAQAMGVQQGQLTTVKADQFNLIAAGKDYFPEGMYLRNAASGEISRYASGAFHVVSNPVATKLGLNSGNTVTITADQYNKVAKSSDYFPDGMLIQNVQTNEVDMYSGGQRHWISAPVATRINLQPGQFTTISASQFNSIPQGNDYFPDGSFLQNQVTGEVSQYSGGTNHVVTGPVAVVMGLNSSQWIPVSQSQYTSIPKGGYYYPEGIFLQNNQTGEVNQYSGGQRHWVSAEVFAALSLPSGKIAAIGADQFNAITLGSNYALPATTTTGNS